MTRRSTSALIRAAVASSALALALGAPAALAATPAATGAPASLAASSQADAPAELGGTLVIGGDGGTVEVEVPNAQRTPEGLIAALAEETGWNLSLASVTVDEELHGITVAFAADSAIYGEPPAEQKDAYHVFDALDYVFSVLHSTACTLLENFDNYDVHFSAPDGGPLDFSNGGYDIYVSPYLYWAEDIDSSYILDLVKTEGKIGVYTLDPFIDGMPGGSGAVSILFSRDDVRKGEGTITVTNSAGEVVESFDVATSPWGVQQEPSEQVLGHANFRTGMRFYFEFENALEPGETYTFSIPEGAFVTDDATFAGTEWTITMAGYGLSSPSYGGHGKAVANEPFTTDFTLNDEVSRLVLTPEDDALDISQTVLTESGTVTFTILEEGAHEYEIRFEMKDGSNFAFAATAETQPASA